MYRIYDFGSISHKSVGTYTSSYRLRVYGNAKTSFTLRNDMTREGYVVTIDALIHTPPVYKLYYYTRGNEYVFDSHDNK